MALLQMASVDEAIRALVVSYIYQLCSIVSISLFSPKFEIYTLTFNLYQPKNTDTFADVLVSFLPFLSENLRLFFSKTIIIYGVFLIVFPSSFTTKS